MTQHKSVISALAAIMQELPAISKTDTAPQGWNYRGIESITRHLQPLLAKHQVVIVPISQIVSISPAVGMRDGWCDVQMQIDWTIYGPGGLDDRITATTVGIGRDNSDKGANKAATQAWKYLLLQLFAIADRTEDSDAADYDHGRNHQPAPAHQPTASELLFQRCKTAAAATKQILRELAADNGRKISAEAFATDQAWADTVTLMLDKGNT